MHGRLLRPVSAHRHAMLELTRQLVAIPTENPPGNAYAQAVELLCGQLDELGLADTRTEGECVLSFVGEGNRTLYLSGHYDVVPAQSRLQFTAAVKGANPFGRGSSDMKGGSSSLATPRIQADARRNCSPILP